MHARVSELTLLLILGGCSCAGRGETKSSPAQPHVPASAVPPSETAANKPATETPSCPPVTLSLNPSEPPIEVRFKMRATADGEVVEQLLVSRADPELRQILQVKDMDALSVLDKCAVRTVDVNFDGYSDVFVNTRAGLANTYAQYWYYDAVGKRLMELGEYPELQPDPARKRLKTYERNGSAGREYEAKEYSFGGGALVLERQEVRVAVPDEDVFERTVFVRRGVEMKLADKRRVPAGGEQ